MVLVAGRKQETQPSAGATGGTALSVIRGSPSVEEGISHATAGSAPPGDPREPVPPSVAVRVDVRAEDFLAWAIDNMEEGGDRFDAIVGNPPFLGGRQLRLALGDDYVDRIIKHFPDVKDAVDFCSYW